MSEFDAFKISRSNREKETVQTLCTNKRDAFSLQNHQRFLKAYIRSSHFREHNRLLLYHGLGSGKTCSAISIANAFRLDRGNKAKIIVITPASLVPNFYKEMKGLCGVTQFRELQQKKSDVGNHNTNTPCVVRDVEKVLDDIVSVMSYQKFVKRHTEMGPFDMNTLFVIDEVQNVISETGSMYHTFHKVLRSNPKAAAILLSGTPIFDKPNELALLGNMLNTKKQLPVKTKEFVARYGLTDQNVVMNQGQLESFFQHKVSYFRGSNPVAYPAKVEYDVHCPMSGFQYEGYLNSINDEQQQALRKYDEMSTSFLIGPRQCSNVVYPNGKLTVATAKKFEATYFSSKKHAAKFHMCANQLVSKSKGPVFVYSNFVSSCGINTFASMLRNEFKFQEVTQDMCPTTKGKRPRFAVFRTGQSEENTRILQIFNSPRNKNGDLIKAILGSPAMKEGVTLLRTREVHLLDPYWNRSRIEQIMGRGVRFCSHKDLPASERRVDVYHYYAVDPKSPARTFKSGTASVNATNSISPQDKTVDVHIRDMGVRKEKTNRMYENILKQVAVDCSLFKHANEPPEITCKSGSRKMVPTTTDNDNRNRNSNGVKLQAPTNNVSVLSKSRGQHAVASSPEVQMQKVERMKKKRLKFGTPSKGGYGGSHTKNQKGCPKPRRVDPTTKACPAAYPHKRFNKYNTLCCYKNMSKTAPKAVSKPMADCMARRKDVLKVLAEPYGYSSGPITKKRLCELMMV